MNLATKMVVLAATGVLAGLIPAAAATAAPSADVAPDGSSATVTANESGPGALGHSTYASGSTSYQAGSQPTSSWCGQVAGVGACATHAPGTNVVPVAPTVCAWWFHDWSNPPFSSGNSCANHGECFVTSPVDDLCRP